MEKNVVNFTMKISFHVKKKNKSIKVKGKEKNNNERQGEKKKEKSYWKIFRGDWERLEPEY